jgi:hypothetical protein
VKEPVVLGSLEDEVAEMQVIAEDEGLEDEEAGALADDLEKLTGEYLQCSAVRRWVCSAGMC